VFNPWLNSAGIPRPILNRPAGLAAIAAWAFFLAAAGGLPAGAEPPAPDKSGEEKLFHNAPASYWVKQLSSTPQVPVESEADIRDRWYAVHALGQLGPEAAEAIGPLEKILADRAEFEYIRGGAAWALGRIGKAARPAVPLLIDTLTSKHVSVRRNSPLALAAIGGDEAKQAITPIAKLLDDEDAGVQAAAALALWQLDRDPRAVPKLARMLEKGKGEAPYQAAVALGRLSPDVGRIANPSSNQVDLLDGLPIRPTGKPTAILSPILPALVEALHHADEDVRRAAARSLGAIGPQALPAIEEAIVGKDPRTSREAAEALGFLGAPAIPALTAALRHADPQVRRIAARALGRLGPQANQARSALLEAVSDLDPAVRDTAADALQRVGTAAEDDNPGRQ
jgi:HEAT repeat protein